MILKSLYLKNYRTYRGPEEIKFASGDKNITIIQGNNEVGKTTIMNAITWCLYGLELYKSEGNEPIWNTNSANDLINGDDDTVKVVLTMEDSKGKEVKFVRDLVFYKNDSGNCRQESVDDNIFIDGKPVSFKSTYLAKHFPEKIKEYFLFDGEQLETYFNSDTNKIKESINKLSQLNLLEHTRNNLKSRSKDYADELEKLNPSLGRIKKNIAKNKENREKCQNDLDKIESNLKKWEKEIKEDERAIQGFGDNPKKLIDDKNYLNDALEIKDKIIVDETNDYNAYIFNNFTTIMSINSLLKFKSIGSDLEEKGFIPSRYKKEFLEYLLEEHECICGADLSEGSDGYYKLKELCDKTSETTNIADTVNILLNNVNLIIDDFPKDFEDKLTSKRENIQSLKNDRESMDKRIFDIEEKLSNDAEEQVNKLQNRIDIYEKNIKNGYKNVGSLKSNIERLESEYEDLQKNLKKEEEKDIQKSDLEKSLDFCDRAFEIINQIHNDLEEEMHNNLNRLTSEEFNKMHWKEFYQGVSIDKNYNVTIHKENADIVPNDLSKGGQLVLALSFMTALNSLSGFELPIIIDTPLGRLDEPIKENIGQYLPIYTRNKQVTLLVTSSEYSDAFRKGIRDYVGEQYELKFIEEGNGMTTIESKKMVE